MSKSKTDFSELKKFAKNIDKLSKKQEITLGEILNDTFISKHSQYNNLDNLMSAIGIQSNEELDAFPENKLDNFINANTDFSSWQDMLQTGSDEYFKKQLGI